MYQANAYAVQSKTAPFGPHAIPRRDPNETDVQMEILFCGICHCDQHYSRDEWHDVMPTMYPCVPGHEIVGRVTKVGSGVTRHKVGDLVGVGCLVDSDRTCPACRENLEQLCPNMTGTYGSTDQHGTAPMTFGGYSESIVVEERIGAAGAAEPRSRRRRAAAVRGHHDLLAAAAGERQPGKKVGIVGLGGLGHMGVKFAKAMGAHVVVFTTSPGKKEDAKRLGADEVIVSKNADEMKKHGRDSFDFILDCVSAEHDINAYLACSSTTAKLTLVGAPEKPMPITAFALIYRAARSLAARSSAASPKRRRCSTSAASTTSRRTSKSSPCRRSTRPTSGCSRAT